MSIDVLRFPADPRFLDRCAAHVLSRADGADPSAIAVVVPTPLLAQPLREALAGTAGRVLLLPSIETLPARLEPWLAKIPHLPDSRRTLAIFDALRSRRWFDEASLWSLSGELVGLFDELTENGLELPGDEAAFEALLAGAYRCRADAPLRFEARLTVDLWRAEAQGTPSRAVARALAAARWAQAIDTPLVVVAEGEPGPFERRLYQRCAERVGVTVCVPDRRVEAAWPILQAAWPAEGDAPDLHHRIAAGPAGQSLGGRVGVVAADGLEEAARAVSGQVCDWLRAGHRRIALVAADRTVARRARALLERERILVADETGWKLSTTRAAALVDALVEVLDGEGYHRDLVDLARSPFAFSGLEALPRSRAVLGLERALARSNVVAGWDAVARAVAEQGGPEATALLARIEAMRDAMPLGRATPAVWLARLEAALDAIDARGALAQDAAGAQLLEWIAARAAELAGEVLVLSFAEWRRWLDDGLEAAMFRDPSIDSPVVMTHLAATRLRRFDAAVLIGAEAAALGAPAVAPLFAHARVREELGLPARAVAQARLRDDLAGLIAHSGACVFVWQHLAAGEPQLLNAELELLDLAHRQAFGASLMRAPCHHGEVPVGVAGLPGAAPVVAPALRPVRISASGFASLLACPYQFYAARLLGLAPAETVGEEMEKRDYGELVHRVLLEVHRRIPLFSGLPRAELLERLEAVSDAVFAEPIRRNFLELGWRFRWRRLMPAYAEWQCAREAEGWRFAEGEQARSIELMPSGAGPVRLEGRLDRIDHRADGRVALLDYKTRDGSALRRTAADPDDVQLAVYALLAGEAVAEAAYLAVDGDAPAAVALDDPAEAAARQRGRLEAALAAIAAGAPMVAHGAPGACARCDMGGVCRREYRA